MQQKDFFDRYEIDISTGRLGGGAFGTVYKAYDHLMDQWKAVKISEVKIIDGKEFSLVSEFRASQSIPLHKNIAHYESVQQFKMPNGIFDYAIMQYYSEGNLKQLLTSKRLQTNEKFALVNGLLQGITFLNNNGVIHRDIKPSNILISIDTRSQYVAKIADFGLSKYIDDGDLSNITNSFAGGTLDYSSPEQLYGQPLKMNTDLWSFGIIVYEIFTGKRPFDTDETTGSPEAKRQIIYKNIIQANIPSDIHLCPYPYDEIIRLCLVADPDKRVKRGDDLINFLKNPTPIFILPDQGSDEETLILPSSKINPIESKPVAFVKSALNLLSSSAGTQDAETTEDKVLKGSEDARLANIAAQKDAELKAEQLKAEQELQAAEEVKMSAVALQKEIERQTTESARLAQIEAQKAAEREAVQIKAKAEIEAAETERLAKVKAQKEADRQAAEAQRLAQIEKEKQAEQDRKQAESIKLAAIAAQKETERQVNEAARLAKIEAQKEADRQAAEAQRLAQIEKEKQAEQDRKQAESIKLAAIAAQKKKESKAAEAVRLAKMEADRQNDIKKADQERKDKEAAKLASIAALKHKENDEQKPIEDLASNEDLEKKKKKRRIIFFVIILIIVFAALSVFYINKAKAKNVFSTHIENGKSYLTHNERLISVGFDSVIISDVNIIGFKADSTFLYDVNEQIFNFSQLIPSVLAKQDEANTVLMADLAKTEYEKITKLPREKITVALLENYLVSFPGSIYQVEINKIIKKLTTELSQNASEETLYTEAEQTQSATLAELYLKKYPKGKYLKEIQKLLVSINVKDEAQMWQSISDNPTIVGLDTYMAKYPNGKFYQKAQQLKTEINKRKEMESTITQNVIVLKNESPEGVVIKDDVKETPTSSSNNSEKQEKEMPAVIFALDKDFVTIAGGKHTLGCDDKEKGCDPKVGTKTVQVKSFMISKFEMTQELYKSITKKNPSHYNDNKKNPVENVSYNEVMEFIKQLNSVPGNPYNYRLPTEAEWEMAALAGVSSTFAGGNDASAVAIYEALGSTTVGKKKANSYGIYDMSGNIAEWCSDDFGDYGGGSVSSKYKVVKGGSWLDKESMTKIKKRQKAEVNRPFTFIGFRLIKEIK